ncbi:MAG: alpha-amylase family glycosyl hydrolase [Acidimicrobiia bacterium]
MSSDGPWWRGAVGYQVYPRSFADSNGDGIGDLEGIRARLTYLSWLGVDAVWISPFYPSPGHDHGYDVSDYTAVSPRHGSLDDFDRLVKEAKRLDLRVLVDIVPNHTSSDHPWFREAMRGTDDPKRDYYLWRDPAPDGGPPNNWVSHFGGPAWTLDPASGQYYCHLFLPEQPDLNWSNEEVRGEFDAILRFWCDRGVDGFRIDVAHGIAKDPDFRDNPLVREITDPVDPRVVFHAYDHIHDLDQDANIEVFRRWRDVVRPYGAMLIGEIGAERPDRVARYVKDRDGLHTVFYLQPVWMRWEPARLLSKVRAMHDLAPTGVSWVINNHDDSRSVTRFGGDPEARERSLAVTAFLAGLGGVPFLFQGEELGLSDGKIDPSDLADPISTRNAGATGRDGSRTAMPWDDGHENGFTTAPHAWLPAAPRGMEETVAGQRDVPGSFLNRYRDLLAIRSAHPELWLRPLVWLDTPTPVVAAYVRGSMAIVTNLGDAPAAIPLPLQGWEVVFTTRPAPVGVGATEVRVPAAMTIILRWTGP